MTATTHNMPSALHRPRPRTKLHDAEQRNKWSQGIPLIPDLIAEREAAFNLRMRMLSRPGYHFKVCNSTMPKDDHYRTGHGEVIQPVRPGADDHMEHPSRRMDSYVWRDGRVE